MEIKKEKAVAYARVSSKNQEEVGYSIPSQLETLRNYAVNNNLEIIKEFVATESAKDEGREIFNELISFLKKESNKKTDNKCRIILVEKIDRLQRNYEDLGTIMHLVNSYNILIHLVKDYLIINKNSSYVDIIRLGSQVSFANALPYLISEETRKGLKRKAQEGYYPGLAPVGYLNTKDGKKSVIVPDNHLKDFVKKVFEWYSTGNYSIKELLAKASALGIGLRKNGKRISASTIHEMLTKKVYYGVVEYKGEIFPGKHEALISKDLYDKVQDVLSGKKNGETHQVKYSFLFKGLLKCEICGCAVTGTLKKNKYVYYRCTGNRGPCTKNYIREEEIEKQVIEGLKTIQFDNDTLNWLKTILKQSINKEKEEHQKARSRLNLEFDDIQKKIDRLVDLCLHERISESEYDNKRKNFLSRQNEIQVELNKHIEENRSFIEDSMNLLELVKDAVNIYLNAKSEKKRQLLKLLYWNLKLGNGKIQFLYRQPFNILVVTETANEDQNVIGEGSKKKFLEQGG